MIHISTLIEKIPNRDDTTCYIIGGGTSAKYLLENNISLAGKNVIGTNNAFEFFDCFVNLSMDKDWMDNNLAQLKEYKGIIVTSCQYAYKELHEKIDICFFNRISDVYNNDSLSKDTGYLVGNNSGHQAINLAYHLGFKKIVLIGFDMNPNADKTHFHDMHILRGCNEINTSYYTAKMIPEMYEIAQKMAHFDLDIVNVNFESNLKCFRFDKIENNI
jgi:hypothetical protein